MRFSVRFILFGLMPYLAVMATLWTDKAPLSGEAALIVGYYFTLFWPLIVALGFIALDRVDQAAKQAPSESKDEV